MYKVKYQFNKIYFLINSFLSLPVFIILYGFIIEHKEAGSFKYAFIIPIIGSVGYVGLFLFPWYLLKKGYRVTGKDFEYEEDFVKEVDFDDPKIHRFILNNIIYEKENYSE